MLAGDTEVILLTFTRDVDGALMDLSAEVSEIELEIKTADGAADPATVRKTLSGANIVLLAQSGDTLGQAEATIDSSDTSAIAGQYRWDVVATLTDGSRVHAILPSDFEIVAVVNQA